MVWTNQYLLGYVAKVYLVYRIKKGADWHPDFFIREMNWSLNNFWSLSEMQKIKQLFICCNGLRADWLLIDPETAKPCVNAALIYRMHKIKWNYLPSTNNEKVK